MWVRCRHTIAGYHELSMILESASDLFPSTVGARTHGNSIFNMSAVTHKKQFPCTNLGIVTPAFSHACIKAEPAIAIVNGVQNMKMMRDSTFY